MPTVSIVFALIGGAMLGMTINLTAPDEWSTRRRLSAALCLTGGVWAVVISAISVT